MDRGSSNNNSKKRTRATATSQKPQFSSSSSSSSSLNPSSKKQKSKAETTPFDLLVDETEIFNISSSSTADATKIFDFPWQKDNKDLYYEHTDHGSDLRDVFFSSLVDGCKAAIGVPGDRLSPSLTPISLPDGSWPSNYEMDSVDCMIWSCVLREPLSLRCVQ